MVKQIHEFLAGVRLPFSAARLILTRPKLLGWSLVPIVVTILLYGFTFHSLDRAAQSVLMPALLKLGIGGTLASVALFLTRLLLLLVGAMTFSFCANLVAIPFNDFLAEAAEPLTTPPLVPVPTPSLRNRLFLFAADFVKSIFAMTTAILLLPLTWLPVVNVLALVGAAWMFAFQFLTYPQTRRGEGIAPSLRFIRNHPSACLGFGFTCMILFTLPVVWFLALPLSVVGGTLLYGRGRATEWAGK